MLTGDQIRCLRIDEWPVPDRTAWQAATTPGDILDLGGPLSSLAPRTLRGIIQSYGRWLAWHKSQDLLEDRIFPAARVRPECIADYVHDLQQRNAPYTVRNRIRDLLVAMRAMAPDEDWSVLQRAHARLHRQARSSGDKRLRLRASSELFELGLQLMIAARQEDGLTLLKRASRFRDGLMVALLAARPLRLQNFTALAIGRSLIPADGGWLIRIKAAETKTRRPIEVSVPSELVPWLDEYLIQHRPELVERVNGRSRGPHDGLWVSQFGTHMIDKAVHRIICRVTQSAYGRPINPHLFRDSAATSIAIEDPVHVRMAANVLGHTNFTTTERHYIQARSLEAVGQFHDCVSELRSRSLQYR
jgi:site-specific recombinase XerD